jgi:hypothetical protein
MYQAYELINCVEDIFTYVFIKDTLNPLILGSNYEQSFLKYVNEYEVALIIQGYNILKEHMSDFGPSYIQINTEDEKHKFIEEMGLLH